MQVVKWFLNLFRKPVQLTEPLRTAIADYQHVTELLFGVSRSKELTARLTEVALMSVAEKKSGEALMEIGIQTARYRELNDTGLAIARKHSKQLQDALEDRISSGSEFYKRISQKIDQIWVTNSDYTSTRLFQEILTEVEEFINNK